VFVLHRASEDYTAGPGESGIGCKVLQMATLDKERIHLLVAIVQLDVALG
jgi:hypothetical protein